ncbi:NYN domain, limkain-b1-type [Plasmopara halstedii]|uniref:NYN domain, limkain-b1-type n=1 Tax=Plasmopara halstedii TaxID=4781 RepID=A0A0P1AFF4_PLAHL|nr:NYN domain, limkain-b1-type [Plasmopara halstedii]CEG39639.1 NYN domain, limkain-b1-type [Plasmopara halstedii]|eukprot:XP_024576008.1 NYN domain, limkain-b1-type [Plasmopara halstedii]
MATLSSTASAGTPGLVMETLGSTRSALIIDGSYAMIGARDLGGKIDYTKLRATLEELSSNQFGDCWFFDQSPSASRAYSAMTTEYHMLKFAPPDGPQFQVSLFPMKKYSCHCKRCGFNFTQNVQKGVDNGIATKILSLAYENICDRFVLFAGDGDFYSSLSLVRNVLRKEIWVMGYRGKLSGDLQQLASRVLWMDDLWSQVKCPRPRLADESCRRERVQRNQWQKSEKRMNEVVWVEDREGESSDISFDKCILPNGAEEVDSGRQVIITPSVNDVISHSTRGRSQGRFKPKGHGRNGRGRSRSRSRDRMRRKPPSSASVARSYTSPDIVASSARASADRTMENKKDATEEKRGTSVRNDKKRNVADNNVFEPAKRGKQSKEHTDIAPSFALSDISSDEQSEKKPSTLLPVPLRPVFPVVTAQDCDSRIDHVDEQAFVADGNLNSC